MCICPGFTLSVRFTGDNHSTNSVSAIEHVVASNKVVSICKNACPAHVEIRKMDGEVQDEGKKERRAPGSQETPNHSMRQ